jgi:hypothetical protein
LKRMPVVNTSKGVVGILTRYDFMKAYIADHQKHSPLKNPAAKAPAPQAKKKT